MIHNLESQYIVQQGSRNAETIKKGFPIIKKILTVIDRSIQQERKRILDPDLSRVKSEIILAKQTEILDSYISEREKLSMSIEDYATRSYIYQMSRDYLAMRKISFMYYHESLLSNQREKLKNRMRGFTKTLIDSLHEKTDNISDPKYGGWRTTLDQFIWQMQTVSADIIRTGILPKLDVLHQLFLGALSDKLKNEFEDENFTYFNPIEQPDNFIVLLNTLQFAEIACSSTNKNIPDIDINNANNAPLLEQLNICTHICLIKSFELVQLCLRLLNYFCMGEIQAYDETILVLHLTFKLLKSLLSSQNFIKMFKNTKSSRKGGDFLLNFLKYDNYECRIENLILFWLQSIVFVRAKSMYTFQSQMYFEDLEEFGDDNPEISDFRNRLDIADFGLGSVIVNDIIVCTSSLIMLATSNETIWEIDDSSDLTIEKVKITSYIEFYESEDFPMVNKLICASTTVSCMATKYYAYLLSPGSQLCKLDSHASSDDGKKEIDGADTSKLLHHFALSDEILIAQIDFDTVLAFKNAAASFTSGFITSAAVEVLVTGLQLTKDRIDNYFIQISWLQTFVVAVLSFLRGAKTEDEVSVMGEVSGDSKGWFSEVEMKKMDFEKKSNPSSPKSKSRPGTNTSGKRSSVVSSRQISSTQSIPGVSNSRQSTRKNVSLNNSVKDIEKTLHDEEEAYEYKLPGSPRVELTALLKNNMNHILFIMTCHRQSLTIQHCGILLIRLLLKEPFLKKSEIEGIVAGGKAVSEFDEEEVREKKDVVEMSNIVTSKVKTIDNGGPINIDPGDGVARTEIRTIQQQFFAWYKELAQNIKDEYQIVSIKPMVLNDILIYIGENLIQSTHLLEQMLLLIYQIAVTTTVARITMVETGMSKIIQRIHELQRDEDVYIQTLCEMCIEYVNDD